MRPKQDFQVSLSTASEPLAGPSIRKIFPETNGPDDFWGKTDFGGGGLKRGQLQPKAWTICPVTCDMGVRCSCATVRTPSLPGRIRRAVACSMTIPSPKKSGADSLSFSETQLHGLILGL